MTVDRADHTICDHGLIVELELQQQWWHDGVSLPIRLDRLLLNR